MDGFNMGRKKKVDPALAEDDEQALESARITRYVHESGLVTIGDLELPKVPPQYQFRMSDRGMLGNAVNAVFELQGGVPAFWSWARQNPNIFYPLAMKMDAEARKAGNTGPGSMNVYVQSNIGQSPLDSGYTLDEELSPPQELGGGEDDDE